MTRLCAIIIAHYKLDDPKCAMERVDIYHQSLTFIIVSTPLLNRQNDKSRDQRSGILHIVRDP